MYRMRTRLVMLFVLVIFAGTGAAQALPSIHETPTAIEEPNLLVRAWSWLSSIFGEAGSFIDPLGTDPQLSPGRGGDGTNAGSFIDPLGGNG